MDERWLSVEEIAEHLGVSRDSIYAWVKQRGMPATRIGKFWKFKRSQVDEWAISGQAADAVSPSDLPPPDPDKGE